MPKKINASLPLCLFAFVTLFLCFFAAGCSLFKNPDVGANNKEIFGLQSPVSLASAGIGIYNVRNYGAAGDGKTLDTTAFQAAIDMCTANAGGTVLVPAGEFLIGNIELKSNVTLRLAPTARILGSTNIEDYTVDSQRENAPGGAVLIMAVDAENVAIEGRGTIDGQGEDFLPGAKDDGESERGRPRAHMAIFSGCKNLSIKDVFFTNSSYHCIRILQCSYVFFDGVRIHTRVNFNNDGFHFNSCEHVKVSNCNIACQDDACALFGSNRDVTVTNCTFSTRWSVFRFGGGNPENITVSNCVINDTFGCPIKMQIGSGSRAENMLFSNLVMNNVTGPVYIGLGSSPRNSLDPNETRPGGIVRNITFSNIRAIVAAAPDLTEYPYLPGTPISDIYPGEHRTCINLTAFDGQLIENITFSDIHITYAGGGTARQAALRNVPQMSGGEYFAGGVMPAYGMHACNVKGLTLNNVRFDLASPDLRPAVVFNRVEDVTINGFSAQGSDGAESLLRFTNTRKALLTACRPLTPCAVFLQVEGSENSGITIDGCDLSLATSSLLFSRGASSSAVNLRD